MKRVSRIAAGCCIIIALPFVMPESLNAETVLHYVESKCPNGAAVGRSDTAQFDAFATHDPHRYDLMRESANQFFLCSQNVDDAHAHDWATVMYLRSMWLSQATNAETLKRSPALLGNLAMLATSTKFYDVQTAAISLSGKIKKDLTEVRSYR